MKLNKSNSTISKSCKLMRDMTGANASMTSKYLRQICLNKGRIEVNNNGNAANPR